MNDVTIYIFAFKLYAVKKKPSRIYLVYNYS